MKKANTLQEAIQLVIANPSNVDSYEDDPQVIDSGEIRCCGSVQIKNAPQQREVYGTHEGNAFNSITENGVTYIEVYTPSA